ncbi:MAG: SAM-dependent methyltransferase, partial [bacterium]
MSKKQADNITMFGGGLYSLATKGAKDVIDIATPRVLDAISFAENQSTFTIADMGCADGGTSLDMIRNVLGRINQLVPEMKTTVIYADQPANDFNALVNIIHDRTDFNSWISEFDNAWPLFSGSSFYLQAVPDNTLDLVFSATAMHWLSNKPCNISEHVHMVGAIGDELEQFTLQARNDWETILMCRARELKSGGRMVLVNFCRDEAGSYLGGTTGVNMFNTFNEIWREFVDLGKVTEEEYVNMTLPQYYP